MNPRPQGVNCQLDLCQGHLNDRINTCLSLLSNQYPARPVTRIVGNQEMEVGKCKGASSLLAWNSNFCSAPGTREWRYKKKDRKAKDCPADNHGCGHGRKRESFCFPKPLLSSYECCREDTLLPVPCNPLRVEISLKIALKDVVFLTRDVVVSFGEQAVYWF